MCPILLVMSRLLSSRKDFGDERPKGALSLFRRLKLALVGLLSQHDATLLLSRRSHLWLIGENRSSLIPVYRCELLVLRVGSISVQYLLSLDLARSHVVTRCFMLWWGHISLKYFPRSAITKPGVWCLIYARSSPWLSQRSCLFIVVCLNHALWLNRLHIDALPLSSGLHFLYIDLH